LGCAGDCIMAVHLIETSEEDSYLAVARYISDLLNEGQVSRRCLLASSSVSPSCSAPLRQATLPRSGKVVGLSRTVGPDHDGAVQYKNSLSAGAHSTCRDSWLKIYPRQRGRFGRRQIWRLAQSSRAAF